MGNGTSRVVGCFVPSNEKNGVDLEFLEPLDEGLGHSFCYVRPSLFDSPDITPSNSERFTVDSSTLDSETLSGSFRQEPVDDLSCFYRHNSKGLPETTFRTISGASVSANVSTARTGNQTALFSSEVLEPAASFESTSSFAAIPLQPIPRGSGPLNGFMSGPLERGFASGPLDRNNGFMSGPIEKGVMSGPLDVSDRSNFSAPLSSRRRKPRFQRIMRSVSGPVRSKLARTFSRRSGGLGWMQRFFLHPATRVAWHVGKEGKLPSGVPADCLENSRNLQWAHGKAGEDRVHVVLSEEQGWLFIGIYDGFSGPDAPDFVMSNLYKAIDKELEGLLWDYEEQPVNDSPKPSEATNVQSDQEPSTRVENSCDPEIIDEQPSNPDVSGSNEVLTDKSSSEKKDAQSACVPPGKLAGPGKKSMRLYELLQLERWDGEVSSSLLENLNQPKHCRDGRRVVDGLSSQVEDPSTSGGGVRNDLDATDQGTLDDIHTSAQNHGARKSQISSKIRRMYQKQKSLRKKLFPWSYDWHREETCVEERVTESSGPIRRCWSGTVDHDAVLRAMARALERTEEAYMEMVEKSLDTNPELALMGSCVLVMLMKDQDVYVMNVGDSRAILAQERLNDRHPNPNFGTDDIIRHSNRSRESLVRMELDRISEESPIHNQTTRINMTNKNRDVSSYRLKMRAVQLSSDHSTSVEEEVSRIRAEHPDDDQAILKDRVKGQLKVTRAFGAGFLKKPNFNEALLEMFRVDYVGTAPFINCIPSTVHHRLTSSDRFLVLSSDGLYEYFSNEEVVAHVSWFMDNVPEGDPAQYLIAELLSRAATKNGMEFHDLLDIPQGDRRKYHDDVSVMVVSLEGRIWRSSGQYFPDKKQKPNR
ncbi:PREDICTED: protein phosphatase 2C 32 [Tarenaya hassleriana]|uniref:protein phosphatase 2C 32 n=1 Tax=Tarenaya hassleriana TaxID=28532 RepID=UPI00053C3708|nr:PREDICTED: protein phosphatase 2C 32 [Tarenaya hassleriana]